MNGKDTVRYLLDFTHSMLKNFVADLSDDDLQVSPVPGANNIAWQLGHLAAAEATITTGIGAQYPALPEPLAALANGASAKTTPDGGRLTKAAYVEWLDKVHAATVAAVEKLTDADLDKPNDNMLKDFAPTVGKLLVLNAVHTMMHAGQFSVTRRHLGKPVLF